MTEKSFFESSSLVYCWQSSWQQAHGFCNGTQSSRIVLWQRGKRALNSWGLCLNSFIGHKREEGEFTWNACKPLKALRIWVLFCSPFVGKLAGETVGSWLVLVGGLPLLLSSLLEGGSLQMEPSGREFCNLEIIWKYSEMLYISQLPSAMSFDWAWAWVHGCGFKEWPMPSLMLRAPVSV